MLFIVNGWLEIKGASTASFYQWWMLASCLERCATKEPICVAPDYVRKTESANKVLILWCRNGGFSRATGPLWNDPLPMTLRDLLKSGFKNKTLFRKMRTVKLYFAALAWSQVDNTGTEALKTKITYRDDKLKGYHNKRMRTLQHQSSYAGTYKQWQRKTSNLITRKATQRDGDVYCWSRSSLYYPRQSYWAYCWWTSACSHLVML